MSLVYYVTDGKDGIDFLLLFFVKIYVAITQS
jgi:hypothetical protein